MHDEHPLVIALCWFLCGAVFTIYFLVNLGVIGPNRKTVDISEYYGPPVLEEELHPLDTNRFESAS